MHSAPRGCTAATLTCLLAALLHGAPARALDAEQLKPMLRVRPGATCLSAESLAPLVEQWLHGETLRADVVIVVEGSATDPRSAQLRVVRAGQTLAHRAFEPGPTRCDYFQAAVSLAIALALKASLLAELGQPLPDDPVARARGWSLSAAGLATYEVVPGFAPGLELGAQLGLGPNVAIRFGALGLTGFDAEFDRNLGSFDATLIAARFDGCVHVMLANGLRGQGCAGLLGGVLFASSDAFLELDNSVAGWVAVANTWVLELTLSARWSLALDLSLVWPLRSVRVGVRDSEGEETDGRSLATVGAAAGLGPTYRF